MPYRLLSEAAAAAENPTNSGVPLTSVGKTLIEFTDELLVDLANRSDADLTFRKACVNWAYRFMVASLNLKECFGSSEIFLTVDQPFYLLPPQVAALRRVAVLDEDTYAQGGRPLLPIDEDIYYRLPDWDDEPTHQFRWRRMLVVYPDPITVRTVVTTFRIRPDDLVADTDSPILPPEFHEAMQDLALSRALRKKREWQSAAAAKAAYKDDLSTLIDTDGEEQGQLVSGVSFIENPLDLLRISRLPTELMDDRG
jgi:hypothetical protein